MNVKPSGFSRRVTLDTMASAQQIKDARGTGTQTAIVSGGRKKIHTTYANGDEMVHSSGVRYAQLCLSIRLSINSCI